MKLFDWLCGWDKEHRDDAAQYVTSEKKPVVICTEQPKPAIVEQTQINTTKSNGHAVAQNGKLANGHSIANGKPPVANNIPKLNGKGTIAPKIDGNSFSVPNFNLIEHDVQGYRHLVDHVRSTMNEKQSQLEKLIENKQLPNEVEEDARAARGKIIVIVKNNLSTFDKLLLNATDEPQQIADLTGFWGLVHKELLDVQKACERVEASRLNNWKYVPRAITPPPATPSINSRTKTPLKSGQQTPSRTPKANPNLRKFMEEKRKAMKSNEQLNA